MQAQLVGFVSAGEAVGVVSISIDEKSGAGDLQSSSYWNLVRQSLKQGPVSSWPAVENKTYSLLRPRKAVCSSTLKSELMDLCINFIYVFSVLGSY